MKLFTKTIFASATLALFGLQTQNLSAQDKSVKMTNPLLQRSTLQYQAPPFDLIKDEHFKICLDNNKASIKDLKSVNENFYKIIYKSKSTDVKWEM